MGATESATSKLELIYGCEGLARVAASTVVVLGLGGVGSNCVEALARGGVGRLVVVDHDVVQASNVNRQAIAFHSTIGRKKTDVMRAMMADINPSAQVESHDRFVFAADVPPGLERAVRERRLRGGRHRHHVHEAGTGARGRTTGNPAGQQHGRRQQAAPRMLPLRRRLRHRELPALPHHAQGGAASAASGICACCTRASSPWTCHARGCGAARTVEPGHGVVRAAHHGPDDRRRRAVHAGRHRRRSA